MGPLTLIIFIPLLGSLATLLVPRDNHRAIRAVATAAAALPVLVALQLLAGFDRAATGMQFVERANWIPSLGISYYLGIDGLSLTMVLVTALIGIIAVLASYSVTHRVKGYFALLLVLETAMFGVFCSLDYILFYVFFELVLVPMYFLIGIWGSARREYAALKFFLYTLLGSVVMLVGILALYFGTGIGTFDMLKLAQAAPALGDGLQKFIFLALWFGFAVKVPVFPFHTWLPDAHTEAPTAVSVILAGVLLKMGTYGFLRITHPTLPEAAAWFAPTMAVLGVIGIVYGGLVSLVQSDLKRLVAYSSVAHMGFMVLGIAAGTPQGIAGAIFYMVSHALSTGMLFLLVGYIYERTHTRDIAKIKSLFLLMPTFGVVLAYTAFASLGLPGLSGFVGEFLSLLGAYPVYPTLVYLGVLGIVVSAAYHLWMMQRVLMGPGVGLALAGGHGHGGGDDHHGGGGHDTGLHANEAAPAYAPATAREIGTLVPLVVLIALLGVMPRLLLDLFNTAVVQIVTRLAAGGM